MNNFLKCILVTWGFQGLQPPTPDFILSTASPQSASSQGSPRISSCPANLSSCDSSAWWSGASPWGAATVWEARVGITRGLRQLSPGKWHRETLVSLSSMKSSVFKFCFGAPTEAQARFSLPLTHLLRPREPHGIQLSWCLPDQS